MRHAVWPRGVARLADQPWAAALVAQHALTVYDRFRPDAEWTSFFAMMEASRGAMIAASAMTLDDLDVDYPFVRLGDLISLAFCAGWTEAQRFDGWAVERLGKPRCRHAGPLWRGDHPDRDSREGDSPSAVSIGRSSCGPP